MTRVLVVMPAHNEEENLAEVLRELRRCCPTVDVAVVDDGSLDRSGRVALEAGATVLVHQANRGYGAALITGYRHALDSGYDVVVRMDADGQHDPAEIGLLLETLQVAGCDVAIGSRMLTQGGYRPSLPRRVGISVFSLLGRLLTGTKVTDPTSGFAAMNRRAVEFLARNTPVDYPDLCVRLALHRAGLRVVETPVVMRPRRAGRSMLSGMRPFIYVPKMLYYIAAVYLRRT